MCVEILFDGQVLHSLGEVRAALGQEPVYHPDAGCDASTAGEMCLCCVDLPATAALVNRVPDWDEDGFLVFAAA